MIRSFKFNQSLYKFYTNLFSNNALSIIGSVVFTSSCNQMAYNVDPEKGNTSCRTEAMFNEINTDVLIITPKQISDNPAIQWMDVKPIVHTTKFIIPLPKHGGNDLIIPQKDGNGCPIPNAGAPITDWSGKTKQGTGIVFYNGKDNTWQAAAFDGESVIIINQVTQEQAQQIEAKVRDLLADPRQPKDHMELSEIEQLVKYIADELKITDMYDSNRTYVDDKLTKLVNNEVCSSNWTHFGLYRPLGKPCKACYLVTNKTAAFQGPTLQPIEKHAAIVKDEDGNNSRLVQTEIFLDTYVSQRGKKIIQENLSEKQFDIDNLLK